MNIRELIEQLEQLAHDHGDDSTVKLYLSIEGQLLDSFTLEAYDEKEIHINSSERMDPLIF